MNQLEKELRQLFEAVDRHKKRSISVAEYIYRKKLFSLAKGIEKEIREEKMELKVNG